MYKVFADFPINISQLFRKFFETDKYFGSIGVQVGGTIVPPDSGRI